MTPLCFTRWRENKIDLRGYRFEHRLEDIQTLNERAVRGELHISAISIHAYAHVASKYALLPCGASMGTGTGQSLSESGKTTKRRTRLCQGYGGQDGDDKERSALTTDSAARGIFSR